MLPQHVPQEVVRGVITFAATKASVRTQFFMHQIHVAHRPVAHAEFRTAYEADPIAISARMRGSGVIATFFGRGAFEVAPETPERIVFSERSVRMAPWQMPLQDEI